MIPLVIAAKVIGKNMADLITLTVTTTQKSIQPAVTFPRRRSK